MFLKIFWILDSQMQCPIEGLAHETCMSLYSLYLKTCIKGLRSDYN
jgi:hypothetical protein